MSTTTIRLPPELKARVAEAAKQAGTTPHGFILQAITEKTELVARQAEFHAVADRRYAEFLESGKSVPWAEARAWLKGRVARTAVERPRASELDP